MAFRRPELDKYNSLEMTLELLSFSGGENTVSEDQACKSSEARICENWEATSLGGMERAKGFNEVADGSTAYTDASDLLIQHKDSGGTGIYGVLEGDVVIKSSTTIAQEDAATFTSGVLCHGVSAGEALWITNSTDNLYRKTFGGSISAATGQPASACARIYKHKNRLVAEGSTSVPRRVYGSRTGEGNWNAANTWSLSNDAWSIDIPGDTRGCVPNFPSGNEILVFSENNCYALSNFPNTAFRPISTPGRGCGAPYSIALGDEGVYFVSRRPTLGVFLFDGVQFTELTKFNKDVFVEKIDFSNRIFGIYRNRKYYLFYNEVNSGVSYPNRLRVFNADFGRWMNRPVNTDLSDNFGYPAVLEFSNKEIYVSSSQKDKWYELETDDNSDEGNDTEAVYTTKSFSSRDFSNGQFPIDDVKIKLISMTITYFGTVGAIGINWSSDRGLHSGSKTISLTSSGALLNTEFTVNSSYIVTTPADRTKTVSFSNDAVGRRFQFTFTQNGTSTLGKIKKVKFNAVAVDEN